MNTEKAKQLQQIVILVILLVVLGGAIFYVWRSQNPTRKPANQPGTTASNAAQPAAGAPASEDSELEKGAAASSGKTLPQAGSSPLGLALNIEANPNSFTVYALSPPKNPFVQEERWYKDVLTEQLPGYPELRDKQFFDSEEPYIPNPDTLFDKPMDIAEATLDQQTMPGQYSISGTSADGRLTTTLALKEPEVAPKRIEWTKASGVPLSALSEPGWEKRHPELVIGGGGAPAAGQVQADGETGALSIPGSGESAGVALAGTSAAGDQIACAGVNLKDGKSSALMLYNSMPYLVSEGSVLPTHYQVLAVKPDGVVLIELRDGSSKWIPLTGYVTAEQK